MMAASPKPESKKEDQLLIKEPADEIEQAIFDLQDVKNCYVNEQKDFEEKITAAKT